jgi:hypothetical protein
MSRRKGEITPRQVDRDYQVEIAILKGGLGALLNGMHDFCRGVDFRRKNEDERPERGYTSPSALRAMASCCRTSCMLTPSSVAAAIKSWPAYTQWPFCRWRSGKPSISSRTSPSVSNWRSSLSWIGGVSLRIQAIAQG